MSGKMRRKAAFGFFAARVCFFRRIAMKVLNSNTVDSGFDAFSSIGFLGANLAYLSVLRLSKRTRRELVYDFSLDRRVDRGTALATALALAEYLRKNFAGESRIGIALPSCLPGTLLNLAAQIAGKSGVNVNFTMGADAARACVEKSGIKSVIGSRKVREKVDARAPGFPWPERFYDVGDILKSIGKLGILPKLLAVRLLPGRLIAKLYRVPEKGGEREASVIFTSGSEGSPKAAVLTHANLVANAAQMWQIGILTENSVLHANLPLFHSFGQTIQVWMCCIFGVRTVTVQSPLEIQANLKACKKGGSTIMISTPTFLRSYYKKGSPEDFESLECVIGGAERTPDGFIEAWEKKFPKVKYLEGYGLTEASPVVCVNLPAGLKRGRFCPQPSATKRKSVGEIFPGMLARTTDPESGEVLPLGSVGILNLKGPNVFGGYLDQPGETAKRLRGGWLLTGDLAYLDADGFIYIKGRLSRFSKIGGEMVPHGGVEDAVSRALGLQDSEVPLVAVGSRADGSKGEALVLLSAVDIDMPRLRRLLAGAGLPNLWIPKYVVGVDSIPVLESGKVNLGAVRALCARDGEALGDGPDA